MRIRMEIHVLRGKRELNPSGGQGFASMFPIFSFHIAVSLSNFKERIAHVSHRICHKRECRKRRLGVYKQTTIIFHILRKRMLIEELFGKFGEYL